MLSKEEVKHIADLSRLKLSEKEIELMQKDLSAVLDYFNLLKKIDTSKIKLETEKFVSTVNISHNFEDFDGLLGTRKDEAIHQSREVVEKLIQAFPDKKDDYIKVKAIL
jgi:aspartyl-tRNA(Asn)/glutamyl-tRNA(Gln) amidotransferase subunit C